MSAAEYTEHAKEFLMQPCSDKVDGYATSNGEVVRFNRATGEYAKGVPGGRIVTKSNLDLANDYFDRLKAAEGVEDNDED